MDRHLALRAGLIALCTLAIPIVSAAAPSLPPGFAFENAVPGVTFATPTAIAFTPDGRLLVAEKRGMVWAVPAGGGTPSVVWSAEKEVLNNGDRGLIGLAVDPNFALNRRIYVLYTVDPDSNGTDSETAAFGRLTRYALSPGDGTVLPESRTILFGASWSDGPVSASLSHAVDCMRFGNDGSLLVTLGDGGHYSFIDAGGKDSLQFLPGRTDPSEDIGSYRAQYLGSLAGKLLRLNPETGLGYPSNPFATADLSEPRSKVWAYGFRNPFRFCMRPGTGAQDPSVGDPGVVYIGDAGLNTWEEIDVADRPGLNFGWPCREGMFVQPLYAAAPPPAHHGCDSVGDPMNPSPHAHPTFSWHHTDSTQSTPHGLLGNCTSGGVFYTGDLYPAQFKNRLFFTDFGGGWLKVALMDEQQQIVQLQPFGRALEGPVDWTTDPNTGDLMYVSIYTGQIRRLRYFGSSEVLPPTAHVSATPTTGSTPLFVTFSSLGSYDPMGDTPRCSWDFGDGTTDASGVLHPSHTYTEAGIYTATLTVTNVAGLSHRDTVDVIVGGQAGFPVTPQLDGFDGPDRALGAPWAGSISGLRISGGALVQTTPSSNATWNGSGAVFGPNQEAFMVFGAVTPTAPEHDLLLKVQGTSWNAGAIQVVYSDPQQRVVVNTYSPTTGWKRRGGPFPVRFAPGDQFGARVYSNGVIVVYKNGVEIGTGTVAAWEFAAASGRIGLMLRDAPSTRIDAFGGGGLAITRNRRPHAVIESPADGTFFTDGEVVRLSARGEDDQDAADQLTYKWDVSVLHNNHVHPNSFVSTQARDSMVVNNHDDGTGVHERIRLIVTDRGGLSDTATVEIFPEIDLVASALGTNPERPGAGGVTEYAFTLSNPAAMPAPVSRWAILAGAVVVAEGDTIVPERSSVRIVRRLPSLAAGTHVLTAVADRMNKVRETREDNNFANHTIQVVGFPATPVIDPFTGPDRPLTAPWAGYVAGMKIRRAALMETTTVAYTLWNGRIFGPAQEAYVRFDSLTMTSPEHDLLLKTQGITWTAGAIQVVYQAPKSLVVVNTYHPVQGWKRRGGPWRDVRFAPGDRFGARATADGKVIVYQNDRAIGEASLGDWPFAAAGGRIGLMLHQAYATRLRDFGGGDLVVPAVAARAPGDSVSSLEQEAVAMEGVSLPTRLSLSQPMPNPALGRTWLQLELPRAAHVAMRAFDVAGRAVWRPAARTMTAGRWTFEWAGVSTDGRPLPAGQYFLRVDVDGEELVRRVNLVR